MNNQAQHEIGSMLEDLSGRLEVEQRARLEQEAETERLRSLVQHWQGLESAKSSFLNLASHELRTPVTVLSGYLAMLDDGHFGALPPTVEHVIGLLVTKTRELNDLIDDMLETARLDDGRLDLRLAETDVGAIVSQLVDDWSPLARAGQELIYQAPDSTAVVEADTARLRIIVSNLLSNAIKYSPGGGAVVCTVSGDKDSVVVAVRDRGLGIAADDLGMLFTRFGRVVTPSTVGLPGTGLGLYIARELAQRHGGDITVESSPGEGSQFTLSLPRRRRAVPDAEAVDDRGGAVAF